MASSATDGDDACDHAEPQSEACSQCPSSGTPACARHVHDIGVVCAQRQQPDCLRLLALPWWLDASAARSRCAGLRPALARCECTPRCPCAPTPPIRSSLPWQCRSARGLERWDEMNLPWASLTPDRWDVGAPWRGTRSHWRVPKCTARAVFACLRDGDGDISAVGGAGKLCQDGACHDMRVSEGRGRSMREVEQRRQASKDAAFPEYHPRSLTRASSAAPRHRASR